MYFSSFFLSVWVHCVHVTQCVTGGGRKAGKAKGNWCLCGRKMTSTVFSRTSQGNLGAHAPPYITAPFAIGHDGVLSHHYPSPSTVTTDSLKCHPQGPKDDCRNVIGSAGLPGCYAAAGLSKSWFSYVSRGCSDAYMARLVGDLSYVS